MEESPFCHLKERNTSWRKDYQLALIVIGLCNFTPFIICYRPFTQKAERAKMVQLQRPMITITAFGVTAYSAN